MKFDELPHDETVEKGLFALLLYLPDKFGEVADKLLASDFYNTTHQQIWEAMTELFKEGKEIDFPNLRIQLKNTDINPQPALEILAEAMNEETKQHHLFDLIKEIKNKSLLRQIIRASKSHGYSAQLDNAQAPDLLATIEKDILSIIDKTIDPRPTDAVGIVNEVQADIDRGIREGWKGYNTGFAKLDEQVGGFIPSQLWIVGANTGVGKTFLLLQMLLNVLKQGGSVVLFSTEMDRKMNMLRLIGNLAGLGTIQIIKNKLTDEELERMKKAQEVLRGFGNRLTIFDNVYTVEEIKLKLKKLQLTGGVNVVAVDYIQNLRGGDSIYERMSMAATELYRITQELNITTLIGSQVSQASADWKSKEAIEFKGAGEIAAVADVALWIKRVEGTNDERQIVIRKIRHGSPVKFNTKLKFPSGQIQDLDGMESAKNDDDIKGQL